MRDFRSNSRSGDRRGSPRRSYGGGGDSRRREMHDAVCDECGRDCKVPFRPSGDKPIYCSDCFERRGGGDDNRSERRDSYGSNRRNFDDRGSSRPRQEGISDRSISQLVEKIEISNTKLDKIISLLSVRKEKTGFLANKALGKTKSKPKKKTKKK